MNNINDFYQTPKELAKRLFEKVEYEKGDSFYEPFRGSGSFYDIMPEPKYWTEIELGKNFFDYEIRADHIITNPPFRIDGKHSIIPIMERCFTLANKSVCMLVNHTTFNSMTPVTLQRFSEMGWTTSDICLSNVKKCYGRYYFLQFTKDKMPVVSWLKGTF